MSFWSASLFYLCIIKLRSANHDMERQDCHQMRRNSTHALYDNLNSLLSEVEIKPEPVSQDSHYDWHRSCFRKWNKRCTSRYDHGFVLLYTEFIWTYTELFKSYLDFTSYQSTRLFFYSYCHNVTSLRSHQLSICRFKVDESPWHNTWKYHKINYKVESMLHDTVMLREMSNTNLAHH